ncbi:MAG: GNAT family N-acetyltransferase [Thermoanaerobaculia bacterium]
MEVRSARPEEVEQLARLWFEAWRDAHAALVPAELTRHRTVESFAVRLLDALPQVQVCAPAGTPAGFCTVRRDEIHQLFVARANRGTGVAAALLAAGEARLAAEGCSRAWLTCAIGHDRAARFYEKRGWQRVENVIEELATPGGPIFLEVWRYEKNLVVPPARGEGAVADAVPLWKDSGGTSQVQPTTGKGDEKMSSKDRFLRAYQEEHERTMRVLRAYPPEKSELRPHPKCKSARELAWIFVLERGLGTAVMNDVLASGPPGAMPPPPDSWEDVLSAFEKAHADFGALVAGLSDEALANTVKFFDGPGRLGDWPRIRFLWFLLSDEIHHRGQLSVYLRMADAKVPSIYGPSADEPWY